MEWQPTPYTVPLLVAALASVLLALYAIRDRSRGEAALVYSFVGVAVGSGVWALTYAAQLSAVTLSATLFWNRFVWVGIGTLAVAWPVFVLSYVDWTAWLRPRRLVLVCLVPAATVGGVLAFGATPLFYQSPSLVALGGYRVMAYTPTPALIGFITYTYLVNLATFAVIGHAVLVRDGLFRRQAAVLLIAGIAPTAAGFLGITGVFGTIYVDFTPVTFAVTSPLIGWVVFKHRLLDLSPIARDVVFTNLSDGVVVVDSEGRIADCNEPARGMFPSVAVGQSVTEAFSTAPAVVAAVAGGESSTGDDDEVRVTLDRGQRSQFLTLGVHAINDDSAPGGSVLLFRDITRQETLQHRYRALIEKSPNVIAVCGTDGLFRYVSPSIARLLGYAPAEVEGRPMIDLVHPDDRQEAQKAFERAFDTGREAAARPPDRARERELASLREHRRAPL